MQKVGILAALLGCVLQLQGCWWIGYCTQDGGWCHDTVEKDLAECKAKCSYDDKAACEKKCTDETRDSTIRAARFDNHPGNRSAYDAEDTQACVTGIIKSHCRDCQSH